MIVNKEQIEQIDGNGNINRFLVISYVNKEGKISFLKWQIPQQEQFEWVYTNRANADKPFQAYDIESRQPIFNEDGTPKMVQWKSYDNKFVKRYYPAKPKNLSEGRLNEIINTWGKHVDPIFESNTPITWYCDIETDVSDEGFPDAETAMMPINTIAITRFPQTIVFGRKPLSDKEKFTIQKNLEDYSELTKDYKFEYREFTSEFEMIEAFIDFIDDIPALTGWNFLGYDWKYIYNRCKNLGISLGRICPTGKFTRFKLNRKNVVDVQVPMHKIIYDYMLVYRQWDRTIEVKENDSLNFVSEKALKITKVEHEWGFQEFYRDHYMEYVFYNAVDTILVEKIDEKLKTAQIWYMLASELRIDLNGAFSTIQPAETVMTNFVYPHYKVVPKKPMNSDDEAEDYQGAYVWPTQRGIYTYIGGLDFASLYPSIMRQFQISPEAFMFKDPTYVPKKDEIKTISGAVYKKSKDSVLPAILTEYFGKRKVAKGERKVADSEAEDLIKIYENRFKKKFKE